MKSTTIYSIIASILLLLPVFQTLQAQDPKKEAIANLSREEKNTMNVCPLHSKKMKLSDNYRANASDFRQSEDYPFAYQLNYRRFCKVCTKTLNKEEDRFRKEERARGNKATMERCTVHSQFMKTNPEFSSVNSVSDKNREKDVINAKQYKGRFYCKTCSKVYSIRHKKQQKEEKKEKKKK